MFQIILTSDSSTDNYPENVPGCFRVDLNKTLNFNFSQLSWEVGLSELFIYPKSWHAIREPFNFFRASVSNIRIEELEKRFYRCFDYHILTEDTDEAVGGDLRIYIGKEYGSREHRYSWSTFRGLPIFYKDLPDPGVPHDKWVSKEDWPAWQGFQETEFWYYRRKVAEEYVQTYAYTAATYTIPPGTYSPQGIVSYISEKCKEALNTLIIELEENRDIRLINDVSKETNANPMIAFIEKEDGKIEFGFTAEYVKIFNLKLQLPSTICYLLGITTHLFQPAPEEGAWFKSIVPPNVHSNTLTNLYVFCDIVQPTYYNDKLISLLRQITCSQTSGQLQHEIFNNAIYSKVSKSNINSIKIWISEHPSGQPILEMFSPNIIVLLFKESKR